MSANPWDERAELYRTSLTHSNGDDLGAVVELCNPHAGVELFFSKEHDMAEWLARTGCEGADAERVKELLAEFTSADGASWSNDYIVLEARKSQR